MSRVFNFSAGPAALPLEVLEQVNDDLYDWQGTGMSVMEVSHRGREFVELAARAESNVRKLLGVPDDYSVLFPQGGATMQMAMAPLNLAAPDDTADYVVTGSWGKKAAGTGDMGGLADDGTLVGVHRAGHHVDTDVGSTGGRGDGEHSETVVAEYVDADG